MTSIAQVVAGSINYHPFGGVSNWTYGNNLQRLQQMDMDGRLTAVHTDNIQGMYYQYNANDEITKGRKAQPAKRIPPYVSKIPGCFHCGVRGRRIIDCLMAQPAKRFPPNAPKSWDVSPPTYYGHENE